jgi:hypothetical protein
VKTYPYLIALLLSALVINEWVIQWAVAVGVGGLSVAAGFQDAFHGFSVSGYLFITAFRLVPYVCLGIILIVLSMTRFRDYVPAVFAGGLIGVLATIIGESWMVLRPLYTHQHVSSTMGIAFLFIPMYAVRTGAIGAILVAALYTPFRYALRKRKAVT